MMRPIDADALMEQPVWFCGGWVGDSYAEGYMDALDKVEETIKSAPTINIVQKWIPCEEKLPEYFEPVITWDGHCYFVEKRIPYILDENDNQIKSEWWVSDDYDEEETDYYPNLRDGAAIEWVPLPEQYEEERNDNENN